MRALALLTALALTAGASAATGQTTWHVDGSATPPGNGSAASPFTTIQAGLDAAVDEDEVLVQPGVYAETLDFLEKRIRLRSAQGPLQTVLEPGDPAEPVVTLGIGLTLILFPAIEGFTVRRPAQVAGQMGIYIPFNRSAHVTSCIVVGHGIGIRNDFDAFLDRCTVTNNLIGVADVSGSAIHSFDNTIVQGNATDVTFLIATAVYATYSNVGGLANLPCFNDACITSFDLSPGFWDGAGGDYHLRPDSVCVDAGDPAEPLDPDGTRIEIGALAFDPAWAPGTLAYCFGSAALCPCGNGGSGAGGCDIPQGTGGVELSVLNFTPDGTGGGSVELFGEGYPPTSQPGVTLIRSPAAESPPVVFGDGLRCISASGLLRIHATLAQNGTALLPVMHGAGAGAFYYQLWNRSTPAMFCDPAAAFNLSNAVEIVWP